MVNGQLWRGDGFLLLHGDRAEGAPTSVVAHPQTIALTPIYVPPPQSSDLGTAQEGKPKASEGIERSEELSQWRSREKDSPLEVPVSNVSNPNLVTPVTAPPPSPIAYIYRTF
ncbi:MAG: hypothetical protein HC796_08865 [Synechococcaceae cyanobacterium RL_1_2]|nr:hypothetical protein [Synechococcaceae cyanobacterium RL_1_2]